MQTNNKLREALTRVKKIAASYINCHDDEIDRVMTEIVATCDSALAEPVKNYEVGTAEDQLKRHGDWCAMRPMTTHPCLDRGWCRKCFVDWMQMPYAEQEGGAK